VWQPCELLYTCYLLLATCCSTQLCSGAAAHHRGRQSRQDTGRGRRSSRRRQRSVHSTSPQSVARVRLRYCSIHSSSPVHIAHRASRGSICVIARSTRRVQSTSNTERRAGPSALLFDPLDESSPHRSQSVARVRLRYCSIHSSSPVQLFELVVASQDAASVDDDAAILGSTKTRAAAMRPPDAITVARVDENLFCWHFRLDDNSNAEIFSYQ